MKHVFFHWNCCILCAPIKRFPCSKSKVPTLQIVRPISNNTRVFLIQNSKDLLDHIINANDRSVSGYLARCYTSHLFHEHYLQKKKEKRCVNCDQTTLRWAFGLNLYNYCTCSNVPIGHEFLLMNLHNQFSVRMDMKVLLI